MQDPIALTNLVMFRPLFGPDTSDGHLRWSLGAYGRCLPQHMNMIVFVSAQSCLRLVWSGSMSSQPHSPTSNCQKFLQFQIYHSFMQCKSSSMWMLKKWEIYQGAKNDLQGILINFVGSCSQFWLSAQEPIKREL